PVLVHRLASLLHASFRPRLAASVISPLRFANPSPPSGWVEDLHLLAVEHARHTKKRSTEVLPVLFLFHKLLSYLPEPPLISALSVEPMAKATFLPEKRISETAALPLA